MGGKRQRGKRTNLEEETSVEESQEERAKRMFYEHMLQRGELVDVEDDIHLEQLPPGVTHVRYPDGRIERIGFS